MSSKEEIITCRKVKAVLRYHVPNQHAHQHEYAHHMRFMYHPFGNKAELCDLRSEVYTEKLNFPDFILTVNPNKIKIELHGELLDTALSSLRSHFKTFCINTKRFATQTEQKVLGLSHF